MDDNSSAKTPLNILE